MAITQEMLTQQLHALKDQVDREMATKLELAATKNEVQIMIGQMTTEQTRVNQAIYLLATGARSSSFRNVKTIAECLADEIINAAKGSSNSYAIKKKDETERVAKANR